MREWRLNKKAGTYDRYCEEEDVVITGEPEPGDTVYVTDKIKYIIRENTEEANNKTWVDFSNFRTRIICESNPYYTISNDIASNIILSDGATTTSTVVSSSTMEADYERAVREQQIIDNELW